MSTRKEFLEQLNAVPNPSFVMDEVALEANMRILNQVEQKAGVNVLCALKGFAMWGVFPIVKNYISGATASSFHEAKLCYETFGKKAHCCFVVYLKEEFEDVLSIASHVTFNSLSQYEKFKTYIPKYPTVKFAIRINPKYSQVGVEKYNPCMIGSRFGVPLDQMPEILPEGISGVHMHALCESGAEELVNLCEILDGKFGHLLHQCTWVNLGGGHHITRADYDVDLLCTTLANFKSNYALDSLMIEPGEAMGWKTGVLVSRIEDIIQSDGRKILQLNVSFSAHMPDCLEMPYKPAVVGESINGEECIIGGNTCMSGDFVDGFKFDKQLKIGELVVFEDMMHYTFVKTSTFNGVPHPALVAVSKDGEIKILRTFDYKHFKYKLS